MCMSEVDYSQFYYKKNHGKDGNKKFSSVPTSQTKKSGKFINFLIIILFFALLFFGIDFLSNGFLVNAVSATLKGNSYTYYMVVSETSSRDMAYAQSMLVQEGGGSGYIWQDDKIYVVYSLYADKKQADAVAGKNSRTFVKSISYNSKNTEIFNFCNSLITDLIQKSLDYENGKITEIELLKLINSKKNEAEELKGVLEKNNKSDVNLLNLAIESLKGLNVTNTSKLVLLSDVRYVCSTLAINMGNYA